MALINHAKREINAKIVYYGPEGGGKRNSLQYIYDRIKPSLRGDLKSPTASGDSLFFFDFSPFENRVFNDYRVRFHIYTLPGKVTNPASWKMTLKGADGLVIVADASSEQIATAHQSISDLRGFLSAYGVGLHDVPCVLQFVKSNLSATELAAKLELPHIKACLSDPVSGTGVLDVLSLLSREIMTRIGQDESLQRVHSDVLSGSGADAEKSDALLSLERISDQPANESVQVIDGKTSLPVVAHAECDEQLQVLLADEGAVCNDGVVRVPLEFILGGKTQRLVLSIAIGSE